MVAQWAPALDRHLGRNSLEWIVGKPRVPVRSTRPKLSAPNRIGMHEIAVKFSELPLVVHIHAFASELPTV